MLDLVGDDQITLSRAQPPAVQGKINKSSEFQSGSTFCRSIKSSDEMRAIMSWRPRGSSRRRSQKEEKETHDSCEITAEFFDIDRGKTPRSRVEELSTPHRPSIPSRCTVPVDDYQVAFFPWRSLSRPSDELILSFSLGRRGTCSTSRRADSAIT